MLPINHFPHQPSAHGKARDLFAGWGFTGGVDLHPGSESIHVSTVCQQWRPSKHNQLTLSASVPCLPLIPPCNTASETDVCADSLIRTRERYSRTRRYIMSLKPKRKVQEQVLDLQQLFPTDKSIYSKLQKTPKSFKSLALNIGDTSVTPYCPPVNSTLTGGCLSSLQWKESSVLCHAVGDQHDEFTVSRLSLDPGPHLTWSPILSTKVLGRVLETTSAQFTDSVSFGVRSPSHTYVYSCTDCEDELELKMKHKWVGVPCSIDLSSFIPGEAIISITSGDCYLVTQSGQLEKVVESHQCRFPCEESWRQVAFASHPRQLFVTDPTSVTLYDIRRGSLKEELFTLPHNSLHKSERITVCKAHPSKHNYYILATQASLVLADLRFPKHPVLLWQHSLPNPPAYMSIVHAVTPDFDMTPDLAVRSHGDEEDVVLLGTQEESEVQAFQLSVTHQPPVKTASPWALSKPSDMLAHTPQSCQREPRYLQQRMNGSLTGLTAVNHFHQGGFIAFQCTVYGDLFYQEFSHDKPLKEKTWRSGPGSNKLKVAEWASEISNKWITEALNIKERHMLETVLSQESDNTEATDNEHATNENTVANNDEMDNDEMASCEAHTMCWLCRSSQQTQQLEQDVEDSLPTDQKCPACGYDIRQGYSIVTSALHSKVIKGQTTEHDAGSTLSSEEYSDTYSQIIQKLWMKDDPDVAQLVVNREKVVLDARNARREELGKTRLAAEDEYYEDDEEEDEDNDKSEEDDEIHTDENDGDDDETSSQPRHIPVLSPITNSPLKSRAESTLDSGLQLDSQQCSWRLATAESVQESPVARSPSVAPSRTPSVSSRVSILSTRTLMPGFLATPTRLYTSRSPLLPTNSLSLLEKVSLCSPSYSPMTPTRKRKEIGTASQKKRFRMGF